MKLSTRLLLAGAVAPSVVLCLALVMVGVLLDRALRASIDRALVGQAAVESVSLFDRLGHVPHLHLDRSPLRVEAGDSPASGALYDRNGRRLLSVPPNVPCPERITLPPLGAPARLQTERQNSGEPIRVLLVTVPAPDGTPHALRLSVSLAKHNALISRYIRVSFVVGLLATIGLLALQLGFLRGLYARMAKLGAHMLRLRRGDLSKLPEEDPVGDELSQLRDAVADATVELRDAHQARERLLADAAHELRTPLAAIRTDVDVTLRRQRSAEELRETLERVREDVVRLAALAQQLLDLAALRTRPQQRSKEDLTALAKAFVKSYQALAQEQKVQLTCVATEPVHGVFALEGMQQILANLVGNALRYAPANSTIRVDAKRTESMIELRVSDQGPGIPEGERRVIFEPFHRPDRRGPGAGLGLAIVRDIALQHGGEALVEETPGGGATFIVRWPAQN